MVFFCLQADYKLRRYAEDKIKDRPYRWSFIANVLVLSPIFRQVRHAWQRLLLAQKEQPRYKRGCCFEKESSVFLIILACTLMPQVLIQGLVASIPLRIECCCIGSDG